MGTGQAQAPEAQQDEAPEPEQDKAPEAEQDKAPEGEQDKASDGNPTSDLYDDNPMLPPINPSGIFASSDIGGKYPSFTACIYIVKYSNNFLRLPDS